METAQTNNKGFDKVETFLLLPVEPLSNPNLVI